MENIFKIKDPTKRKIKFIALLSKEILKKGGNAPIVVGGEALEIYTQGSYTTGDIDLKAPKKILESLLKKYNFKKKGRIWFNEELEIYIDWQGEKLDEGKEAEKRVNTILVEKDMEIKVISYEDLIVDRLNAFKWWQDSDSFMWAKVLYKAKEEIGEEIDINYLKKRAKKCEIEDIIEKLLIEMKD